jgi:hypothetical protein
VGFESLDDEAVENHQTSGHRHEGQAVHHRPRHQQRHVGLQKFKEA